jgi:hypothetical protein
MISLLLDQIEKNDTNYDVREVLIYQLLALCKQKGFECGVDIDPSQPPEDRWSIIRIILPDIGEISWHMPPCTIKYDGHSIEEKYERCRKFNEINLSRPLLNEENSDKEFVTLNFQKTTSEF